MSRAFSRYWEKLRSAIATTPQAPSVAQNQITIVSGLPRTGTSMMMQMLEAGGLTPLTDGVRKADTDNPEGYYEFERVKQLSQGDTAWLEHAQGKTVKVIAALLEHLPADYDYRVVFMQRSMEEILRSQKQMLVRRGEPTDKVDDEELGALFRKHLSHVMAWIAEQPNFEVLYVQYNEVLKNPAEQVQRINRFFGDKLDAEKMVNVIDPSLYRQRQ